MRTQAEVNAEMNALMAGQPETPETSERTQAEVNAEMNALMAGQQNLSNMPEGSSVDGSTGSRTGEELMDDIAQGAKQSIIGATQGLVQGATLEMGDEFEAAGETLIDPDTFKTGATIKSKYEQYIDSTRARHDEIRKNAPISTALGTLVGAMMPWSMAMKGAGALKTAVVAGGTGALEYIGGEDEWEDVTPEEAAMWGLAAAVPAEIIQGGISVFRKSVGAKSKDQVADILQNLVDETGLTPEEIIREANKFGPQASLVDATGASGTFKGMGLAATSGDGPTITKIKEHLQKVAQGKARIKAVMTEVTGKEQGSYYASLEAMKKVRKANADKAYGEALDNARIEVTPAMSRAMMRNPTVKAAWKRMQDNYAERGVKLRDWYDVDAKGNPLIPKTGFTLQARTLQELKFEMDSLVNTGRGATDHAGKIAQDAMIKDRNDIMRHIYAQNDDFRQANILYAGDSAMLDAQELGKKHGLGGANIDEQMKDIEGLNESERDAYLQGIMSKVFGKMGQSPEDSLRSINSIASENATEVLEALVGKAQAAKIMRAMLNEKRYRSVAQDVLGGSQTNSRKVAGESFNTLGGRAISNITEEELSPMKWLFDTPAMQGITSRLSREVGGRQNLTPEMRSELADLMFQPGGTEKALDRLSMAGFTKDEASRALAVIRMGAAAASQPLSGRVDGDSE